MATTIYFEVYNSTKGSRKRISSRLKVQPSNWSLIKARVLPSDQNYLEKNAKKKIDNVIKPETIYIQGSALSTLLSFAKIEVIKIGSNLFFIFFFKKTNYSTKTNQYY